jgi:hypothetical protein
MAFLVLVPVVVHAAPTIAFTASAMAVVVFAMAYSKIAHG